MGILAIIGIHILALIVPGPDFLITIKNSLQYSKKIGIMTAIGFGLGVTVHIIYCLAGLAIIISKSIIIFNLIKLLGASYLIYIGIKSIFSKMPIIDTQIATEIKKISSFEAIKIGFLTNILNPKVTLFFLSLFSFIAETETSKIVIGIASLIMILSTIAWFSLVSIFFTQKKIQSIFKKFQETFNKIFGGLLLLLGIKIIFNEK